MMMIVKNNLLKYLFLFIRNLFKINRYKFLNYQILYKNYKFNEFIKEIVKKYGRFKKLRNPIYFNFKNFENLSKKSFNEAKHLKDSKTSRFFYYELNSYFNNDYFICLNSTISKKLLNSFHLFPPNIFVLEKLFEMIEKKLIGDNFIVDFPCGLTNFHQYLSYAYKDDLLIGIDNFSQLSRDEVNKYQEHLKSFDIFENAGDPELLNKKLDVVVAISIDIKDISEDILNLNSNYIFIGSSDLEHNIKNLEYFLKEYKILEVNHAFILMAKKNLIEL